MERFGMIIALEAEELVGKDGFEGVVFMPIYTFLEKPAHYGRNGPILPEHLRHQMDTLSADGLTERWPPAAFKAIKRFQFGEVGVAHIHNLVFGRFIMDPLFLGNKLREASRCHGQERSGLSTPLPSTGIRHAGILQELKKYAIKAVGDIDKARVIGQV
ncbi:hypothetical protein VTN02DRAFT_3535 [Thermoascus thermophilus]